MSLPHNNPYQKKIKLLTAFTALVLLAGFIFHAWQKYSNVPNTLPAREACNLHEKACSVRIHGGKMRVTLEITPKNITHNTLLTFQLTLENIPANTVLLDIAPLDDVRDFKKIPLQQKNNHYLGNISLDTMKNSQQTWLVIVHIQTPEENIAVPFRF